MDDRLGTGSGTELEFNPGMPPVKLLSIVLGLSIGLAGASSASATESSMRCDDMLIDLSSTQAALTQMEDAVDANARSQEELRTEASTLAATIADELREGATEPEVQALVDERQQALDDLASHQKLRPALDSQLEALLLAVDDGERDYIACVESSIND